MKAKTKAKPRAKASKAVDDDDVPAGEEQEPAEHREDSDLEGDDAELADDDDDVPAEEVQQEPAAPPAEPIETPKAKTAKEETIIVENGPATANKSTKIAGGSSSRRGKTSDNVGIKQTELSVGSSAATSAGDGIAAGLFDNMFFG
eukprot:5915719-Pyramimonas_sp.AAC.1